MAYLLTKHDPYHVHSISGGLTLLHFIVRWFLLLTSGSAWHPSEGTLFKIATVSIHAITPTASLVLPIPTRRNIIEPMIWPEFRLHSLVFSLRHTLSTIVAFVLPFHYAIIGQTCILHLSMVCASNVSYNYGDRNRRTTNAMPYPPEAYIVDVATVKRSYAYSQMFAAAMSICGNADFAFMPLLAIQTAPLMMTLVRKGFAKSDTYHFVYSMSLAMPSLGMIISLINSVEGTVASSFILACGILAHKLRVVLCINKHKVWIASPIWGWLFIYIYHQLIPYIIIVCLKIIILSKILLQRSTWISMSWFVMRIAFHQN